jgi:hypothetical protein
MKSFYPFYTARKGLSCADNPFLDVDTSAAIFHEFFFGASHRSSFLEWTFPRMDSSGSSAGEALA